MSDKNPTTEDPESETPAIRLDSGWQLYREQKTIYDGNFTQVPNFLLNDDLNLNPFALKLFLYMLRFCLMTDKGVCFMSSRTLALRTHMSVGMVSKSKDELIEKGLILIVKSNSGRGRPLDNITIRDIWKLNRRISEEKKVGGVLPVADGLSSPDDLYPSPDDLNRSPDDMNQDVFNKTELTKGVAEISEDPGKVQEIEGTEPGGNQSELVRLGRMGGWAFLDPKPGREDIARKIEKGAAASDGIDLDWMSPDLQDLVRPLCDTGGIEPPRDEQTRKRWIKELQNWRTNGRTPERVRAVVGYMINAGLTMIAPWSITGMLANKAVASGMVSARTGTPVEKFVRGQTDL